jgi:hypothetical protein
MPAYCAQVNRLETSHCLRITAGRMQLSSEPKKDFSIAEMNE